MNTTLPPRDSAAIPRTTEGNKDVSVIRYDSPMADVIAHFRECISWYRRHNRGGALTVDVDIMERLLDAALPHPPEGDVEAIRERAEKATAGPLGFSPQAGAPKNCLVAQVWHQNGKALAEIEPTANPAQASADAELFSHARADILTLCDALSTAQQEIDRLRGEVKDRLSLSNLWENLWHDAEKEIEELKGQLSTSRRTALLDGAKVADQYAEHYASEKENLNSQEMRSAFDHMRTTATGIAKSIRTLAEKEGLESRPAGGEDGGQ